MEINLENNILQENNLEKEQNKFLDSALGSAINNGIDIGIRCLLPDYAENFVIDLKNNLLNYGLKDGISQTIKDVIETGKSMVGIFNGKFKNVNQINNVVKNGGIIDSVSGLLDDVLYKLKSAGKINSSVFGVIRSGKNAILSNVEKNIQSTLDKQITSSEYLNKYIGNWEKYFKEKNFDGMEKEINKIKRELKNMVPIENTILSARNIEMLHSLIKNNGKNFELSNEELELANKLCLN